MSTLENCKIQIREITNLLRDETSMLSQGRFEGLDAIVQHKTAAMMKLQKMLSQLNNPEDINIIQPHLSKLQVQAKENGLILERVVSGVKSAQERLRAVSFNEAKVGAYNRAGTKLFLSEDQIRSEKII